MEVCILLLPTSTQTFNLS